MIADATGRGLLDLLYQLATFPTAEGGSSAHLQTLRELAGADEAFASWLGNATLDPSRPTTASEQVRQLPQLMAGAQPILCCHDPWLTEHLHQTSHLVCRVRAMNDSALNDAERRHQRTLYNFAYGLSHEFNNPLASIATRAGMLAAEEQDPRRQQMLQTMVENAMRGCEMLGDLMLLARPPAVQLDRQPLRTCCESFWPRVEELARRVGIELRQEWTWDGVVNVDPAALSEALWCLVRNAIEAQPDGGHIMLRVAVGDAKTVRLTIQDAGQGLSAEALDNCFDPFYSGREAGRGLGMGLAKARRLVELQSGTLRLTNLPGGGCSAIVELPR